MVILRSGTMKFVGPFYWLRFIWLIAVFNIIKDSYLEAQLGRGFGNWDV